MLQESAQRITKTLRSVDVASRYGGDEFNLLLVDAGDKEELGRIADKLLQAVTEPAFVEGEVISVTLSMGIAIAAGGENVEDLLRKADAAMYAAKKAGKNRYSFA